MTTETIKGLRRDLRKRVPLENGNGFTTVLDGHEFVDVEVVVDMEAIARRLGSRAAASKRDRSTALNGAVVVNVLRRQRVPR